MDAQRLVPICQFHYGFLRDKKYPFRDGVLEINRFHHEQPLILGPAAS